MAQRPQNECTDCGYTWYPRGKDLSLRCPSCGSQAVQLSPWPVLGLMVGGVVVVVSAVALVGCLFCGGLLNLFVNPQGGAQQQIAKRDTTEEKTPPPDENDKGGHLVKAPRDTRPAPAPRPGKSPPVRTEEPTRTGGAPKLAPDKPVPVPTEPTVEQAPLPRLLPPNRPPAGFASAWDQCGEIETRVVGATVVRPILTSAAGDEFTGPDPLLVIWVETRSRPRGRAALRRWQGAFNSAAALTDTTNVLIEPAKLPTGSWLGGQLKGEHSLKPGGPGVIDVLAFRIPPTSAHDLWLTLNASHVSASGKFLHKIPEEAWRRRRE